MLTTDKGSPRESLSKPLAFRLPRRLRTRERATENMRRSPPVALSDRERSLPPRVAGHFCSCLNTLDAAGDGPFLAGGALLLGPRGLLPTPMPVYLIITELFTLGAATLLTGTDAHNRD